MSMPKLKMYPAKNGDAFLIEAAETCILIDAGYASTFTDGIAKDLVDLSGRGRHLNLLVSTHIDADHIGGLIELLSVNGASGGRSLVEIDNVWHNSLRSLHRFNGAADDARSVAVLEAIRRRGLVLPGENPASIKAISAAQGSSLARLLRDGAYRWNGGDGTECVTSSPLVQRLNSDVAIRVVGPSLTRLEALRGHWLSEMRSIGYRGGAKINDLVEDAYEMWCASMRQTSEPRAVPISADANRTLKDVYVPDTSIANGSSIAFTLCADGANMLFLGDAWTEDVIAELSTLRSSKFPLFFDAIKVSHHGSLHNTSVELLELVDAPCYFLSSDGSRHGHPDFEVLAEIVDRPASFERNIYVNYETPTSQRLRAHTSKSGAKFSVRLAQDWVNIQGRTV